MGKWLYILGNWAYWAGVQLASTFSEKAKLFVQGREGWKQTLAAFFSGNERKTVWFHCASLGEFEQGRPVMERFKEQFPDWNLLVTFFSPSGYNIRKDDALADAVLYLPFDSAKNARDFVRIAQPDLVIFIKYEFWYFFLREIYRQNIPLLLVSGIFRPSQWFFKSTGAFYRKILHFFSHFFVQDATSVELLASIGLKNVTLSGDTRYDRVRKIYENRKPIPIAQEFKNEKLTLVAGSTWPEDIAVLSGAFKDLEGDLKLIIAPHEIGEGQINTILQAFPSKKAIRYSEAQQKGLEDAELLIIDNIGMLSSLYQYGDFAFVGGAFAQGLHNTLEAATYGIPVVFGAKYDKYREAIELVKDSGGFSVKNSSELRQFLNKILKNQDYRKEAGRAAFKHVQQHTGATGKVMDWLILKDL